ncbi:MAG: ethylbenzene dehydrogenase-related protein [Actinomycetota bacterium]|nr:ethylbenzene dehydrogenase-related protein [Actinomycetota bacterium]
MNTSDQRISRRNILKGAAGAGTVALVGGCAADPYDGPGVYVGRVNRVPTDDIDHHAWRLTPEKVIELGPQDMALPQQLAPSIASVRVRSIHDGVRIGFHLEWDDPDANDLTIRVDDYRDACAVLLVPGTAVEVLRPMGSATTPATLLHWKADWQRDIDQGRQGLEAVYPNRAIDTYPIVYTTPPDEVDIATYQAAGATEWLPGIHVGNPISSPSRTSPVEKAIAYGFSTTTTAATQDATGRGARTPTGWRVIITKPLTASDDGEFAIPTGTISTVAFAAWSGAAHDAGSRKCPARTVHALNVAN